MKTSSDKVSGFAVVGLYKKLLAPRTVLFLSSSWEVIGHKGGRGAHKSESYGKIHEGPLLERTIAAITGIPERALHDYYQSKGFTTEERLAWIVGRETLKSEDMYYSMLGLFNVSMPVIYGESAKKARQRLLRKIAKTTQQSSKIADWLSPPDP